MRKVINGKRYDTETAEVVGEWGNGYGRSDFHWCQETLYVTAKGAFFLHGEGGGLSRYSESYGDSTGSGETIVPMGRDEAQQWCEEHDQVDALEEYFSDDIEEA